MKISDIKEKKLYFLAKIIEIDKRINEILFLNNNTNIDIINTLSRLFLQRKNAIDKFNIYLSKTHIQN